MNFWGTTLASDRSIRGSRISNPSRNTDETQAHHRQAGTPQIDLERPVQIVQAIQAQVGLNATVTRPRVKYFRCDALLRRLWLRT
jgi:hypothetical protein